MNETIDQEKVLDALGAVVRQPFREAVALVPHHCEQAKEHH